MNISIDRQRAVRVIAGGAFLYCGALTLKAAWQGEFQAARLPATGMAAALLFWTILGAPSSSNRPHSSPIYSRGGIQFYQTSFQGPLFAKKGDQEVPLVPALFEALSAPKGEASLPYDFFKALSSEETAALVSLATEKQDGSYPIVAWDPGISVQLLPKTLPLEVQQALLQRYQSNTLALSQFLTLFPKMLGERSSSSESSLVRLALSPLNVWRIKELVRQMKANEIPFSPEEQWVALAAEDDSRPFADGDFLSLPKEQQERIFYFANGLEARGLVQRLKRLGMGTSHFQHWVPMSPFAYEMDMIEAEAAILRNLQGKRRFSRTEFEQLPNRPQYLQMHHNLLQISTTDGLKRIAHQRGCGQIIFPEYSIVVNSPEKIKISRQSLDCSSGYPLTVYVEKRDKVERKLTAQEVVQLMTLIWHADCAALEEVEGEPAIFATSSGVYFQPTGCYRSRGATLETLERCAEWVSEEDRAAVLSEAQRIASEPKEIEAQREANAESYRANPYGQPLNMVDEVEIDLRQL